VRVSSEPPAGEDRDRDRGRLERTLPELMKRVFEVGVGKLSEGPESLRSFVQDLKLPKEVLTVLVAQLEETKHGMSSAVAREVREFLEQTNLGEQLAAALSRLSLEVKTEIRFVPNEAGVKPRVSTEVRMSRPQDDAATDAPKTEKDENVG
jgi:hypothetical protein